MLASQLVEQLLDQIDQHGDHEVVSGVDRSGYGESVEDIVVPDVRDFSGEPITVFDLVLADESICET